MSPLDVLRTALYALGANRLRAALALLGIVLGVGAVTVLVSIGRGVSDEITGFIETLGTNVLFVSSSFGDNYTAPLTLSDAEAIDDELNAPSVKAVAPNIDTFGTLVSGNNVTSAQIAGVTPEFLEVRNLEMASGIFISSPHLNSRAEVAVLGSSVSEALFENRDPTGEYVRINGRRFRIIGMTASGDSTGFQSFDRYVFMPITTVHYRLSDQRTISGEISVSQITVQAIDDDHVDAAVEEVERTLRLNRRVTDADDFEIFNQQELLESAAGTAESFTVFLGTVAGISLLVGGIGIMNIMLVSVTERTREIGIRQAMGAKRRDVLAQFVTEAIFLTLGGGILGVVLGIVLATVIDGVELGQGLPLRTAISTDIVLLALAVSVGIGMFFGIYPAIRAARMNPIEALRYE